MPNKGKTPAQTFTEMVEAGREQKKTSKLYKAESAEFVDDRLTTLISKTTAELADAATAEPVGLRDIEEVKRRTVLYLKSCEATATFPSVSGLARSMGLTRRAIYHCIEHKSPAPAAEWLELVRDTFSDILSESALRNNCNSITAIFLQKALYGLRETVELVATQQPIYGEQKSIEQIELEYAALPDSD